MKIEGFMYTLDQRKDESIEQIFAVVNLHFRKVFSEFVNGGSGCLVLMENKGGHHADGHSEDVERRVEKYLGLEVQVSFSGGTIQPMVKLSEGQKNVIALALIFAMQRCKPAPFYLFDEIDAVLDLQNRTAVRNLIKQQADGGNTQFITTTSCPELLKGADKIYKLTNENGVSVVNAIQEDAAIKFIMQDHNAD